jgi:hypothetical protein
MQAYTLRQEPRFGWQGVKNTGFGKRPWRKTRTDTPGLWLAATLWGPASPQHQAPMAEASAAAPRWRQPLQSQVAVCIVQEIIYRIHLGQTLFGSLWLLHNRIPLDCLLESFLQSW